MILDTPDLDYPHHYELRFPDRVPMEYLSSTELENPSEKLRKNIYPLRNLLMKTNEILNQISSLELDISNLDHSDFRELHWLSEDDVKNIKEELLNQVTANRTAAEEKINFVLGQRRKKQGYIAANNEEILALQQSNESHQAEIRKLDAYLMYILSALGSDAKHKVSVQNGVIYLGTKRAKTVIDEDKLPHEMFRLKNFVLALDPVADQEKLKEIVSENITASVVINVASLSQEEEKKLIEAGVSEDTLASKKEKRTQEEIKERYNSLEDKKEKERYKGVITVIDNEKELKIN